MGLVMAGMGMVMARMGMASLLRQGLGSGLTGAGRIAQRARRRSAWGAAQSIGLLSQRAGIFRLYRIPKHFKLHLMSSITPVEVELKLATSAGAIETA